MFKIVYCKCNTKIVLSQTMPEAEKYEDFQKDVRNLVNNGHTKIEYVEKLDLSDFDRCFTCYPEQVELDLI